jgi:hypothetical protein
MGSCLTKKKPELVNFKKEQQLKREQEKKTKILNNKLDEILRTVN